jgi:Flp pilus assembly protein TadG
MLNRRGRNLVSDQSGQGALEFIVTLPLYLLLFLLVLWFGLYMWMQIVASVALHDGVRVTAETGSAAQGYARARSIMEAGLGGLSAGPVSTSSRGVLGRVDYAWRTELAGLGIEPLRARASSFARLEQFYGGPPGEVE